MLASAPGNISLRVEAMQTLGAVLRGSLYSTDPVVASTVPAVIELAFHAHAETDVTLRLHAIKVR